MREISLKVAVSVRRRLPSASHGMVPQTPGRAPRPRSTPVYSDPEAKPTAQSKTREMATMATMAQSEREGAKCARAPARVGEGEKFAERTVKFEA